MRCPDRWVKAPSSAELTQLAHTMAWRVGRFLERRGLVERDAENGYLAWDAVDEDPMNELLEHSVTYRIADGLQQVARYSPCKPCRLVIQKPAAATRRARRRVSVCTPGWRPRPMNATSWNGSAATLVARRSRKSGYHERPVGKYAMS